MYTVLNKGNAIAIGSICTGTTDKFENIFGVSQRRKCLFGSKECALF